MNTAARSAVLIAVLVGVAYIAVTAAVKSRTPPKIEQRSEPTLPVRALSVLKDTHRPALFLIGSVEARDYAALNAPIESDVLRIRAREGDFFRKGTRLIELDTRDLEYAIQSQQAQLDELDAQLESISRDEAADRLQLAESERLEGLAQKDHERNKTLFEKKVLPLKQLEQSEQTLIARRAETLARKNQVAGYGTQRRRVAAQKKAAVAQLDQTYLLLEHAELQAPFAGRVAKVHTAIGARPARGAPLMDIFNHTRLRLRIAVAQRYAAQLKSGDVQAVMEDGGASLTLAYDGIEPRVESGNSSIDAFFKMPSKNNWILGEVRDVVVELAPVENVFAAPVDAIYNDRFVYRVDSEKRAEAVECERLGLTLDGNETQVLIDCPQLADNDSIVAHQLPNLLGGVLLSVIVASR